MDSFDFILQNSETAQQHENTTVIGWIHSDLFKNNDNNCHRQVCQEQFKINKSLNSNLI